MTCGSWVVFLIAAAAGAPLRYLVDGLVQDHTDGPFPWGTFVVNISGCLALGLLTGLGLYHGLSDTTQTVIGTGGLGAYTTFSTFSYETVRLAEEGATTDAVRNALGGLVIGLAAASAGLALAAIV
jgi:CrcB protein